MDELEISGKRYISAKRAGKENKYHPDYIGQLIRANKVVGQKVGRSWYVDEESLTKYFSGEMAVAPKVVTSVAVPVVAPAPQPSPIVEQPVVELPRPVQHTQVYVPASMSHFVQQVPPPPPPPQVEVKREVYIEENPVPVSIAPTMRRSGLTYMSDESPLYPQISKRAEREVEVIVQEIAPAPTTTVREQYIPQEDVMSAPVQSRSVSKGGIFVLATLGVLTFIVIAAGSYLLNYSASVEGENTSAAVKLGF